MTTDTFYSNVRTWGNEILFIGYENGQRVQKKIPYKPTLYVPSPDLSKNTEFKSYNLEPLEPMEFDSITDAKNFIKSYQGVSNFTIYGMDKWVYQYIADKYKGTIEYLFPLLRIFYIDIEVSESEGFPDPEFANEEITAITIKDSKKDKITTWGMKPFTPHRPNLEYRQFADEASMLMDFVKFWMTNYPDVLTGWNSRGFDLPYIVNRITKILGEGFSKKLSPWGIVREKTISVKRFGQQNDQKTYELYGIAELDYMDLYKKYSNHISESYTLAYVTQTELGETKLEYTGSLGQLYEKDPQKFFEYNIKDADLIAKLEAKLKFIELIVEIAYIGHVATYEDALGTVKYWEVLIYNHLMGKKQVSPLKKVDNQKVDNYAGAYVKEPITGKYSYVMSYDVASLYPSVIRQYNLGPETLIANDPIELENVRQQKLINMEVDLSWLKTQDVALAANNKLYKRDRQSFMSELMEQLFALRKDYKNKMSAAKKKYQETKDPAQKDLENKYHIKQYSYKILLNSGYGAIGNQYFQFYDSAIAESVTITGQVIIKYLEKRINDYLNKLLENDKPKDYCIYIDTDSIYIDFSTLITKLKIEDKTKAINFLDKVSKEKIEPKIDQFCKDYFEYTNGYTNNISMVRDVICDSAVWTGKKRYFMNVHDSEGVRYAEPQVKVLGIEVVKSSTPKAMRETLKKALEIILRKDNNELIAYIEETRNKFLKLAPEDIAFPRSINDLAKYKDNESDGLYIKGTPMHVRASLIYNNMLQKTGMERTYGTIKDGNKIKFIYLLTPNPVQENIIAFIDVLPKEFGLHKFIDYQMQFEKTFLQPLQIIADFIDWKTEKTYTLEDIFGS